MVNGAAVLEYGNHLPSFHELPLGFAVRTTIPDKRENEFFVQDSLILLWQVIRRLTAPTGQDHRSLGQRPRFWKEKMPNAEGVVQR